MLKMTACCDAVKNVRPHHASAERTPLAAHGTACAPPSPRNLPFVTLPSHRATWCTTCVCAVWASAILCVVRRPVRTPCAWVPHLPVWDYHGSASVLVWLWWLEQSSHDVDFQLLTSVLYLHKLCCQLCCQLCCTDYIFIIRFYSAYICHPKINNRQNVTPALKNRFSTLNAEHNTAFLYNIGRAGRK